MKDLYANDSSDHPSLLLQSEYADPSVFSVFPKDDNSGCNENSYQADPSDRLFDGLVDVPDISEPEFLKLEHEPQIPADMTFSPKDEPCASMPTPSSLLPTQSWNPMPCTDNNHISHVILPYCCCGGNHWHGDNSNNSSYGSQPVPYAPYPWHIAPGSYGDAVQSMCLCGKEIWSKGPNGDGIHLLNLQDKPAVGSTKDRKVAKSSKSSHKSHAVSKKNSCEMEIDSESSRSSPVAPVTQMRCQTVPGYQKSRRTKTSYDPKTSYRLNTLFFESFGNNRKPTKEERRRIQKKTGITSRRLTYWLSNHKRRFGPEINAYKRLSKEGQVNSYDEFMQYCNKHYVPEIQARQDSDLSGDNESEYLGTESETEAD